MVEDLQAPPADTADAWLRLHLISHRAVTPHSISLDGVFGVLTNVVWTSEGLAPGQYTFLGYFDVDGSSDGQEERDPDSGDPVTLPTVNKFTIEAGETVEITVRFDLVFS